MFTINTNQYSRVGLLTTDKIGPLWLDLVKKEVICKTTNILIRGGEKNKTIHTVVSVWKQLLSASFDRRSLLIVLGGGVTCDLGGFIAGTYMRGIDHVLIPTSLLAMVDASIGGKTGFDFDGIKNSIGLFKNPVETIVNPLYLTTLPKRELVGGFAEMIKHAIIADRRYFMALIKKRPTEYSLSELSSFIATSRRIKQAIVDKDEKESHMRKMLNFGHTIGHAIEALSLHTTHPLRHGEAIAVGMIAESWMAMKLGMLDSTELVHIENVIKRAGLRTRVHNISVNTVMDNLSHDKKHRGNALDWSLPRAIGKVDIVQNCPHDLIKRSIEYIRN